jgi:two-component system, OmpR family, alkaline phosphatase synthesis response regulator PhoP
MRILLVEDEENIRDLLRMNLEMEGYEVVTAGDGKKAIKLTKDQHFDLLILDIMIPEINGIQVCEQVRLRNAEVPIVFLTAKDNPADKIEGLKRGADDYVTKPFNLEEFLLRIHNLLRRSGRKKENDSFLYQFDQFQINFQSYTAVGLEGEFPLTNKEVLLLKLLIERKNEVVSREQILQTVWGYDVFPSTRTIDNFILSFRKYFETDPKNPKYFHSVRGVGYKFTEPDHAKGFV